MTWESESIPVEEEEPQQAPQAPAPPGPDLMPALGVLGTLAGLTPAGIPAAAARAGFGSGATRPREKALAVGQSALGFGDEMTGATGAALDVAGGLAAPGEFPERYRALRDVARGELEDYRARRPVEAAAYEAVPGMMLGGGLGGAAARTGPVRAVTEAVERLPALARIPAATAIGTGTAATGGATVGAGQAPELADVPAYAARGAKTAALTAAPLIAGVSSLAAPFQALSRWRDPGRRANARVRAALDEAGITTEPAAREALETAGEGARIADIGEGTRKELQYLSQRPGRTGQAAQEALETRADEIAEEVTELAGGARKFQLLEDIERRGREVSGPLYDRAYAAPTPMTDALRKQWRKPTVQKFWRSGDFRERAQEIADAEDMPFDPAMFETAEPSTMGWDYLIRAMDNRIEDLKTSDRGRYRTFVDLRKAVADAVKESNPALAEARASWAGGARFREMMEEGEKLFRGRTGEWVNEASKLDPVERMGWFEGAKQAIADAVNSPTAGVLHDATRKLRTRGVMQRLRPLFDTQEEFDDFYRRLDELAGQQRTLSAGRPSAGSQTGGLAAREDESRLVEGLETAGELYQAPTLSTTRRLLDILNPAAPGRPTRDLTGAMLLETDPARQAEILQSIYSPPPQIFPGAGLLPFTGGAATGGLLARPEPRR